MAASVIDASAFAALLFGEPEADVVAAALDGDRVVAPSLLGFELANAPGTINRYSKKQVQ